MEHVTCLAHDLHRVAKEGRRHFSKEHALLSNVKKMFVESVVMEFDKDAVPI